MKSGKKVSRTSTGDAINKRFTHVGVMLQTPNTEKITPSSGSIKKSNSVKKHSLRSQHQSGSFGAPSSGSCGITLFV